jgi:hypothetical protein
LKRSVTCTQEQFIPYQSELVPLVPVLPDTIRVPIKKIGIPLFSALLLQNAQVSREDAFELRAISATIRLARLMEYTVTI